jgi:hypothetical protein
MKYIVKNPRGVPEGIQIISHKDQEWYESDEFKKPNDMPKATVTDWIKRGYLEGKK